MSDPSLRALMLIPIVWLLGTAGATQPAKSLRTSTGSVVTYEDFGVPDAPRCLVLLHGASGPAIATYQDQARFFAAHGYHVLLPHYFDASHGTSPTTDNYTKWAEVAAASVNECRAGQPARHVLLLGFSLGASVALAAGSQQVPVDALADWYGSLPDDFFYRLKGMPPLLILHGERDTNIPIGNAEQLVRLCELKHLRCDHHFYPDAGHGFTGKDLEDADRRTLEFFDQLTARAAPSE